MEERCPEPDQAEERLQELRRDPVLREVHFRPGEGDKVGLIGRNGSEKTTLLRPILRREEPFGGTVEVDESITIGYFSQFSDLSDRATIEEVLDGLFWRIHALEEELAEIGRALEQAQQRQTLDHLLHRQAELFEEMERRSGWVYQTRIDTVLSKLGFSETYQQRPIE